MNKLPLLLTRENLLSFYKETTEELAQAREKKRLLERLLKTDILPNRYWFIVTRIHKTKDQIKRIKESFAVYQEHLDFMSIG